MLNTYFDRIKGKSGVEIGTRTPDPVLHRRQENIDVPVTYRGKHECRSVSVCPSVWALKVLLGEMFANSFFSQLFISVVLERPYYFTIG